MKKTKERVEIEKIKKRKEKREHATFYYCRIIVKQQRHSVEGSSFRNMGGIALQINCGHLQIKKAKRIEKNVIVTCLFLKLPLLNEQGIYIKGVFIKLQK